MTAFLKQIFSKNPILGSVYPENRLIKLETVKSMIQSFSRKHGTIPNRTQEN